ncbi:MAG: EamA family transporter [Desulfurivibrionaceae bacterium]
MDHEWFSLSIACAFSLASADACAKKFFSDCSPWVMVLIRFGVPAVLLSPFTLLCPLPAVPPVFWVWIALLVPLEILAMWLYMSAIRDSPLYLTLPYLAFTPVFNILTGYLVLAERVSWTGSAGIILVVAGAYSLNLKQTSFMGWRSWLLPFTAIFRERGSRLMMGVALIYSLTSVLGKHAMSYATPLSFGPFYFVLIGCVMIVVSLAVRREQIRSGPDLLRRWPGLFLVGGFLAVMVITHFTAIAQVEVAYFISLKRSSLLFGILYGALFFGERSVARHFLAGGLMVAGIILIMTT